MKNIFKKVLGSLLVLTALFAHAQPAHAAFLQPIAFEVDAATGNDTNGGGFDAVSGVPGTNYAWGAGQTTIAYTDLTTTGAVAILHSVARPFIAADVGNVVNIVSGTNFTAGRYQIISVSAGAATVDRNCATGVGATGTGTLGGSLLTIQAGINAAFINAGAVDSSRVYVKKGAYTGTVALTTSGSVSTSLYRDLISGYFTTHDDLPSISSGNQPTYSVGSGAGVNGINVSTSGVHLENITFIGTATSGTRGVVGLNWTGQYGSMTNVKVTGFSSIGVAISVGQVSFTNGEITGTSGNGINLATGNLVANSWIHKNTLAGIAAGNYSNTIYGNIISNNTTDGVQVTAAAFIFGNTIYGNRDGIATTGSIFDPNIAVFWQNNVITNNSRYGINVTTTVPAPTQYPTINYNAFYSNTTANYNGITAGVGDVAISVNPFNSSTANLTAETAPDWGLNSTASAGASLRAVGFPGNLSALTTTTGFRDIGPFQHQDSGTGGGGGGGTAVKIKQGRVSF